MRAWLLIALLVSGCAVTPRNPEQWMANERNACLPTAVSMAEGLKRQGIQAKVVRYAYNANGRTVGHAVTAYLYPPGSNTLYTYDYEGSWRTRAFWNDPLGIATAAERLRSRFDTPFFSEFL